MRRFIVALMTVTAAAVAAQAPREPDWTGFEEETLRHFQTLVRFDTTDPPGGERPAAEYLKQILDREGIPTELFALEAHRPNLVARLKGNGKKRPLAHHGAHRHGQRRPCEVEVSTVQRHSKRRPHLRSWHSRRQGQRRGCADVDADVEAAQRAART